MQAGTARWVPKRMSQDTTNQTVCNDPRETGGKKAQALLTQSLPSYKAAEFQERFQSQI